MSECGSTLYRHQKTVQINRTQPVIQCRLEPQAQLGVDLPCILHQIQCRSVQSQQNTVYVRTLLEIKSASTLYLPQIQGMLTTNHVVGAYYPLGEHFGFCGGAFRACTHTLRFLDKEQLVLNNGGHVQAHKCTSQSKACNVPYSVRLFVQASSFVVALSLTVLCPGNE